MEVDSEPVNETLSQILIELTKVRNEIKAVYQKTEALGKSCHDAFLQIVKSMTTLREELSEASGTLISDTFCD